MNALKQKPLQLLQRNSIDLALLLVICLLLCKLGPSIPPQQQAQALIYGMNNKALCSCPTEEDVKKNVFFRPARGSLERNGIALVEALAEVRGLSEDNPEPCKGGIQVFMPPLQGSIIFYYHDPGLRARAGARTTTWAMILRSFRA